MFHSFRVIGVTSDAESGVLGPRLDECGFMVLDFRGLAFTGLGFVFGAIAFVGAGFAGRPLFVLGLEGVDFATGSLRTRTVRIGAVWTGDFRGLSVLTFVGRIMAS